jgi:hypothetical protein
MEVGDDAQAMRVVQMASHPHHLIEIWRDWPNGQKAEDEEDHVYVNLRRVDIKGTGQMRAVVLYTVQPERLKNEWLASSARTGKELRIRRVRKVTSRPSGDCPD